MDERAKTWLRIGVAVARILLLCVLAAFLVQPALLFLFQENIIYHPAPYADAKQAEAAFPRALTQLAYEVDGAKQVAFYAPPMDGTPPDHIWILFGGNASHALDYHEIPAQPVLAHDAFLLVDYPGYGLNAGKPSPDSILKGSEAALSALAAHLGTSVAALNPRLGIIGHSIGTGAALALAEADPGITRVVLVAPFTSLCDMGRLMLGYPVCALVRHNVDNEAALNRLAARAPRPAITILHGGKDTIVPVAMSRTMAAEHPGWIAYRELPGDGHVDIVIQDAPVVAEEMARMERE